MRRDLPNGFMPVDDNTREHCPFQSLNIGNLVLPADIEDKTAGIVFLFPLQMVQVSQESGV